MMRSKWEALGIVCFFMLSSLGAVYAQNELSKALEFRDFPKPSTTTKFVVKPWREDEKVAILKLFKLIRERAPGLLQRATAYRPILLYRSESVGGDIFPGVALAEANGDEHSIYFADRLFRERRRDWTFVHELAHLADSDLKMSASKTWVDMVQPLMKHAQYILEKETRTGKVKAEDIDDLARKEGLPTAYASLWIVEAFADYIAAIVLDDRFSPPASIKAFLQTKALSTPFKPDESTRYIHLGMNLLEFEKGKMDEAIDAFDKAIKLDPNFGQAYKKRAQAWLLKKDWDKAISDLSQVIRIFPRERGLANDLYLQRGWVWMKKNEVDRAIADFSEAIDIEPRSRTAYYHRGLAWRDKKDLDRAIADFSAAIRIHPDFSGAYYERGLAWRAKKDLEKAIADFSKVIALLPGYTPAYYDRGWAWWDKKEFDKAIADLSETIRQDPKFAPAYLNRGRIWRDIKKDFDRAIADFSEVIKLEPDNASAYYERGEVWRVKKELDKAIADFSETIRLTPGPMGFSYFYRRGQLFRDKKEFDKAIADFSEVIKVAPTYTAAYYYRGLAWWDKKEFDKAIADFSETIRQDPKFLPAYLDRGRISREVKKDLDRAIADFSEGIKVEPGDWRARYNRGLAWRDKKDLDRAIADYGEAIKLLSEKDPFYGRVHFRRAELYLREGKWTEALADLEKGGWGRDLHVYYYGSSRTCVGNFGPF